jgi:hypothetical protein
MEPSSDVYGRGIPLEDLSSITNQAPFKVIDVLSQQYMDMIHAAGLVATVHDETCHALKVHTGYAVLQKVGQDKKKVKQVQFSKSLFI